MFKLNPNLRGFWSTRKMYKILKGGRFSSKTQDAAGMAIYLARNYSLKFMCLRMFQNRIADSVYTVLVQKIEDANWQDEFEILNNTITHKETGSSFIFYGIARNIKEIKGTEGVDVCWIEEGEALTREQWDYIDPTLRGENSEIWVLYNPRMISDFVESELVSLLEDDVVVRCINYPENPFLSETAKKKAERLKRVDFESYEHIYLAVPLSDDDQAVIKRSWVEAAIDAHIKLDINMSGAQTVGYDVADSGEDKNAIANFNGSICEYIEEWKAPEDELDKSALRAWSFVEGGMLSYDSIGVGAHVGATLKRHGHKNHAKFNAGDAVFNPDKEYSPKITNKQKFENLKAQAWQDVADRLRNTYNAVNKGMEFNPSDMISISSEIKEIESLKTELCSPHKDYSKRGLDMVESKKDMAKRGIKSPNKADAFIMGACPHLVKGKRGMLNIYG